MRAQLLLAEAATQHPDGTISLLRAGITQVWGAQPPFAFRGALVVRIEHDLGDEGKHAFDLKCLDADGQDAFPKLQGEFAVGKGEGTTAFILNMQPAFPKEGDYIFVLRVDRVQLGQWKLHAAVPPKSRTG